MTASSITVRIDTVPCRSGWCVKASVSGVMSGRWATFAVVMIPGDGEQPPADPEELVTVALRGLYAAVYHL